MTDTVSTPAAAEGVRQTPAPGLLDWFGAPGRARWLKMSLFATVCLGLMALLNPVIHLAPDGEPGSVRPNDFSAFWAGARVGLEDGPAAALDPDAVARHQRFGADAMARDPYFPFLYPPLFLLLVLPLGLLSYAAAYVAFVATGVAAYAAGTRLLLPPGGTVEARRTLWLMAIGGLVLLSQVTSGQLTLLWVTGLVVALGLYERGRPVAAGLVYGLLSVKPTLCLLLPLVFLARRDWRAVAAAAVSVILVAALPTLWAGTGYWEAWLNAVERQSALVAVRPEPIEGMFSWYAFLRGTGLDHGAALTAHWVVTLGVAGIVAVAWGRPGIPFAARAGVLLTGIAIATPYAWYYESLLVAVGLLYLVRDGWGTTAGGRVLFFAVWAVAPFLPYVLQGPVEYRMVMAPVMTLAFAAAVAHAGVLRRRAGHGG